MAKRLKLKDCEPLKPPKIASDKNRCQARMSNRTQCVRKTKVKGLCFAHWREEIDRQACAVREQPIDSTGFEYEGRENELIAE